MNKTKRFVKSNSNGFLIIFIFLITALLIYKFQNPKLVTILLFIVIIFLCFEIFSVLNKNEYNTTWFVVASDLILIITSFIFIYYSRYPIESEDSVSLLHRAVISNKSQIVMLIAFILNSVFKSKRYRR